jgi:hypothetical protein
MLQDLHRVRKVPQADMGTINPRHLRGEEGNPLTRIMVLEVAQRAERVFELMSLFPSGAQQLHQLLEHLPAYQTLLSTSDRKSREVSS